MSFKYVAEIAADAAGRHRAKWHRQRPFYIFQSGFVGLSATALDFPYSLIISEIAIFSFLFVLALEITDRWHFQEQHKIRLECLQAHEQEQKAR